MRERDSKERFKGKIKFNEEEKEFLFPEKYDDFKNEICQELSLTEEELTHKTLIYNEKDEDIIEDDCDYNNFIFRIKQRNIFAILIIKDGGDSNINSIESLNSNYIYNNNMNYNNFNNSNFNSNNINYNNNCNLNNERYINNKYINNNNNSNNNKNINNFNNNNFNNSNNNNQFNNNNNVNNNNQANNNSNNNNHINLANNEQANEETFQVPCSSCQKEPLEHSFYYCPNCGQIFCENCEMAQGSHPDLYYKIRNKTQFDKFKKDYNSNTKKIIGLKDKIDKISNKVALTVGKIFENWNNN